MKRGAFVHSSDNDCLGMLFVLSGEIRTYLLSEEGLVELKRGAITLRDTDGLDLLK